MVDKIAHVVLNANGANVNDFLVAEGHARVSEENYMSKVRLQYKLIEHINSFCITARPCVPTETPEHGVR